MKEDGKEPDAPNKPVFPDDAFALCEGTTFTVFAPYPYGIDVYSREAQNGEPLNDAI